MASTAKKQGVGSVIWEYLTTVDHKKIAILYLIAGGFFFVLGGIEAMLIRIQLAVPNNDFLSAGLFNEVITMHGTTMIFLAAMPLLFGIHECDGAPSDRGTGRCISIPELTGCLALHLRWYLPEPLMVPGWST